MRTPERSRTSQVSQIVKSFWAKVPFLLWIEKHMQIHLVVRVLTDSQNHRRKDGSDSMTSTADAGGNKVDTGP